MRVLTYLDPHPRPVPEDEISPEERAFAMGEGADDGDVQWFKDHPHRHYRLRPPGEGELTYFTEQLRREQTGHARPGDSLFVPCVVVERLGNDGVIRIPGGWIDPRIPNIEALARVAFELVAGAGAAKRAARQMYSARLSKSGEA